MIDPTGESAEPVAGHEHDPVPARPPQDLAGADAEESSGDAEGSPDGADDDLLDRLRKRVGSADTNPVVRSSRSDSRITWNSVVGDDDPVDRAPDAPVDRSSFQFDLGGALAKFGDEAAPGIDRSAPPTVDPPTVDPPTAEPPAAAPSAAAPPAAAPPTVDPPTAEPPAERFDSVAERAPETPPRRASPTLPDGVMPSAPPADSPPQHERSHPTQPTESIAAPSVLPQRVPTQSTESTSAPSVPVGSAAVVSESVADALPRREVPVDAGAVQEDAGDSVLPKRVPAQSTESAAPERRSIFDDDASHEARAALHRVPSHDVASAANPAGLPSLPTLPAAMPSPVAAAPAAAAAAATGPTTADIHKFRAAQQRAASKNRQGRMFGRVLVVMLLIGGAVGGSLVFGRAYLFPDEWSAELTPLVDEMERGGAVFERAVPLVVQSPQAYAATLGDGLVASLDMTRLPEWRALGIAGGSANLDAVAFALAAQQPAFYDAASGSIYRLDDPSVDLDVLDVSLRAALRAAFDEQIAAAASAGGVSIAPTAGAADIPPPVLSVPASVLGTASPADLVRRIGAVVGPPAVAPAVIEGAPLPIAYDLAAPATLAGPLAAAGYDLSGRPTTRGADDVIRLLDDTLPLAPDAPLDPSEIEMVGPVSLGTDDWTMIWSNRMSIFTVDRLIPDLVAESYRSFDRSGVTCFTATFVMRNEEAATDLAEGLQTWVAAAPANAQAVAAAFSVTGVSLTACDPGAEAEQVVNSRPVADVLARQAARAAG